MATGPAGRSLVRIMMPTWYVTFEIRKRGTLPKRRSPRATRTFATEAEAKEFVRAKLNEGLPVFAGTINPHLPRRLVPASNVTDWLTEEQDSVAPLNISTDD